MLKRVLFFPSSSYLRDKWWHRLATVAFWGWVASVGIFALKTLILDPFSSCIAVKYPIFGKPSDLDCGINAFDYAPSSLRGEPLSSILVGTLSVVAALYIAAVLPSLAYRIGLYVAQGAAWKDSQNSA